MKKVLLLWIFLAPSLVFSAKKYPILDPGDPDLTKEKADSKNYKDQLAVNVNKKPFSIKNPNAILERGILPKGYRICFVGDTGNGSKRQKMIADLMQNNCDQIRHLGDLIYYVGVKDRKDPLLTQRFLDVYKNLTIPMYIAVGNHDYYLNPDVWLDVSREFPQKYILPNNYYFEMFSLPGKKGLCFITLDTTPLNDADSINAPRVITQLQWIDSLNNLIKNRCNKTYSFAHHPYLPPQAGRDEKSSHIIKNELYEKRLLKFTNLVAAAHDHFLGYYFKLPKSEAPNLFHQIPELISGTGGMLNVESEIAPRNFGKIFRESGFVQMKLLSNSDDPNLRGTFRFINHLGNELLRFIGP